jgi:ATP/maltotriose-dependent transcriptional regulator MalT/DNA-binding SARP family transcriptional activator
MARGGRGPVNGYPVQPAKVQRPPLRDETLARDRLLDWLHVKIHHRAVFVIAEAGYGKTTLLADFSRRTRLRTFWYRLDDEDRNWIAFLTYLVAAGRELDPEFAPLTAGLLGELESAGSSRQSVVDTFIREFSVLGDEGAVVILDDFHVVDDAAEIRDVVRELIAHAPERVTFVVASRRTPALRVARLRALGEVAELTTDDLRFSETETEQLFRETYRQPLEADVLDDLSRRTEGWAASLQLVQAAIRDRSSSEVRSFVRSITGAEGDLYDYLAEEVIGDLPDELQDFLMKTSVLEFVSPNTASLATELTEEECRRTISDIDRVGLLSHRHDVHSHPRRYHPLVRGFLEERLERERGRNFVLALHARIGAKAWPPDWKLACRHYSAAAQPSEVHRVMDESIREIMGAGQFSFAAPYLLRHPPPDTSASLALVASRIEYQSGRLNAATNLAERALEIDPGSDLAAANMIAVWLMGGQLDKAHALAARTAVSGHDPAIRSIAQATHQMLELSLEGGLTPFVASVMTLAERQRADGFYHYQGISLLNVASALRVQGQAERAWEVASQAIEVLEASSASHEVASARLVSAWALAHIYRWDEAQSEMAIVKDLRDNPSRGEILNESGEIHLWYGDESHAKDFLNEAAPYVESRVDIRSAWQLNLMELEIRQGRLSSARQLDKSIGPFRPSPIPGYKARRMALRAYLALGGGVDRDIALRNALDLAMKQEAWLWVRYCRVLEAASAPHDLYSDAVIRAIEGDHSFLSILAELLVSRLRHSDEELLGAIAQEARRRPIRWRPVLRREIDASGQNKWPAAHLLDEIGATEDIVRLRSLVKSPKTPPADRGLGKTLARRLAPTVFVEDQGRVLIRVGRDEVAASSVRRKVLALLCFLLSRPGQAASRDQVLDAMWPDLEPLVAINSLNQTIYFLRRVFEPRFQDDTSPDYLNHDSNVVWLDRRLVSSRSIECLRLIEQAASGDLEAVDGLSRMYRGKFALDFEYEEWALPFRDSMHASYLQIIESSVMADLGTGNYSRGIVAARRALEVDPSAEQLQIALLRLYRNSGAHAAAAEQYALYAHVLRTDLGIEPVPLEAL